MASASSKLRGLFVVGFGRVGGALAARARAAKFPLAGIETRDAAKQRAARKLAGKARTLETAALVALSVPDSAVASVASALIPRLRKGQIVFHNSGSLSLAPLAAVERVGALSGSLHPYCSVAGSETPLRGATCAIDGSPKARAGIRKLALAIGMRPLAAPPTDRIRYHLSAVLEVASAGVAAIAATKLLGEAGVKPAEARAALAAILRSVAFNLERDNPAAALTGPFARGDLERIRLQLQALAGDDAALTLYRAIGSFSARLSPRLSEEQRRGVEELLRSP